MTLKRALAVAAALAAIVPTGAQAQVEWRVQDRFRLFDRANTEAKARVAALAERLESAANAPLDDFYEAFLALLSGRDGSQAHGASLRTSNYEPAGKEQGRRSGRYVGDYLFPARYFVELRVAGADPAARCTYESPLETRSGDCRDWTPVAVMDGAAASRAGWRVAAVVRATVGAAAPQPVAIDFADELVVALGDSYISGEGNPDVPSVITDRREDLFERPSWGDKVKSGPEVLREAGWWDEPCHRSLLSWPVIASFAHSARDPHRAVTLVHLGCSGAIARDVYLHGETELPGGGDERESQLALLDRLRQRPGADWGERKVDRVLLSVGGNDIGFVGVLTAITLPPNGYLLGPAVARYVGKQAEAVCPYEESGKPLARLCETQRSAQKRLEELPGEYRKLAAALATAGIGTAQVYQAIYPNPLIGEGGVPCDTNPNNDAGATGKGAVPASGFEALMGVLPRTGRGLRPSWGFELRYDRETDLSGAFGAMRGRLDPKLPIDCDWLPEPGDSEVCQALWVHARLNQEVQATPWHKISSHYYVIAGHGLCRSKDFPLALPLVQGKWWVGDRTPQTLDPYAHANPRWFRVPNDSIVTQFGFYGDQPRFHQGTVHPTFNAHLAVAQAAYDTAFGSGSAP